MKVLAGLGQPAGGWVSRSEDVGYLAQDPEAADPEQQVRARILSARGLQDIELRMRKAEKAMASADEQTRDKAMRRYANAEAEYIAVGWYAGPQRRRRSRADLVSTNECSMGGWAICPVVSDAA